MSDPIDMLRRLAEKLNAELTEEQRSWSARQAFVYMDDRYATEVAEVLEPHAHRRMLASYIAAASPGVVLELLRRVERAEGRSA